MNNIKFYINKYSHIESSDFDTSFIPMLMRRKLNILGKIGLYTLNGVYEQDNNYKLVFASSYGDVDRVSNLIKQKIEEGEISPAGFSFSVHNATIGLFSLLKGIKSSYNSISAGDNTIQNALTESILLSIDSPVLFCYAETLGGVKSVSISISQNNTGFEVEYVKKEKFDNLIDDYNKFIDFLDGKSTFYETGMYILKRS